MTQCTANAEETGASCSSAAATAASECNSLEVLRDAWAQEPPSPQPSDSGEAEGLMAGDCRVGDAPTCTSWPDTF